MRKNLLVTLADENYIEQAKQLFSSVYWNAGWKGDYMLLSQEIPKKKLKWFTDKGIQIKKCKSLYSTNIMRWSPATLSKFNIFSHEFKKWKKIIYLDADIIVRASLDDLLKIKGFGACMDVARLDKQFVDKRVIKEKDREGYNQIKKELKRCYNLSGYAFGSGTIVFDTKIIKKDTFNNLTKLFKKYKKLIFSTDQPILNLMFYKRWEPLPRVYGALPNVIKKTCGLNYRRVKGIIIHPYEEKPWTNQSFYYEEWRNNLNKAELINLKKIMPAKKWTKKDIEKYCKYLKKRRILFYPTYIIRNLSVHVDSAIGKIGILIKNFSPELYHCLKKIKKAFRLEK